jgi:hypothetical protein
MRCLSNIELALVGISAPLCVLLISRPHPRQSSIALGRVAVTVLTIVFGISSAALSMLVDTERAA